MVSREPRRFDPTREELEALYSCNSTDEIARQVGVSAEIVRRRLHEHGISPRCRGARREFNPCREELERLYQQYSAKQIADQMGVGETVVWKRLEEYGIKLNGFEDGGHRAKTGKVFTKAHLENMSKAVRGKIGGEKNPNWRGGVFIDNIVLRRSKEYRAWKMAALQLRGNRCQGCGAEHGKMCECCGHRVVLHVHHVKSFSKYPEHRFDPENSEVLCPKCHWSRHRGKPRELKESPNVETRATLSQAAEGNGSAEGATVRPVSPNNNPAQERAALH